MVPGLSDIEAGYLDKLRYTGSPSGDGGPGEDTSGDPEDRGRYVDSGDRRREGEPEDRGRNGDFGDRGKTTGERRKYTENIDKSSENGDGRFER